MLTDWCSIFNGRLHLAEVGIYKDFTGGVQKAGLASQLFVGRVTAKSPGEHMRIQPGEIWAFTAPRPLQLMKRNVGFEQLCSDRHIELEQMCIAVFGDMFPHEIGQSGDVLHIVPTVAFCGYNLTGKFSHGGGSHVEGVCGRSVEHEYFNLIVFVVLVVELHHMYGVSSQSTFPHTQVIKCLTHHLVAFKFISCAPHQTLKYVKHVILTFFAPWAIY